MCIGIASNKLFKFTKAVHNKKNMNKKTNKLVNLIKHIEHSIIATCTRAI